MNAIMQYKQYFPMATKVLYVLIIVGVFIFPFASASIDTGGFGDLFGGLDVNDSGSLWDVEGLTRFLVIILAAAGLALNFGLEKQVEQIKLSSSQKMLVALAIPIALIVLFILKIMTLGDDGVDIGMEYGFFLMVLAAAAIAIMEYGVHFMKDGGSKRPSSGSSSSDSDSSESEAASS